MITVEERSLNTASSIIWTLLLGLLAASISGYLLVKGGALGDEALFPAFATECFVLFASVIVIVIGLFKFKNYRSQDTISQDDIPTGHI